MSLVERQILSPEHVSLNTVIESTFEPFICDGVVSLSEDETNGVSNGGQTKSSDSTCPTEAHTSTV